MDKRLPISATIIVLIISLFILGNSLNNLLGKPLGSAVSSPSNLLQPSSSTEALEVKPTSSTTTPAPSIPSTLDPVPSDIDANYSNKLDSCLSPGILNATDPTFNPAGRIDCDRFVGSNLAQFCSSVTEYHAVCNDDRRHKYETSKAGPVFHNVEIVIVDSACDESKAKYYVSVFNNDVARSPQRGISASCLADENVKGFADLENTIVPRMRAAGNTHQLMFAYPESWKQEFHIYFNNPFSDDQYINMNKDEIGVGFAPDTIIGILDPLCTTHRICASEEEGGVAGLIVR